MSDLPPSESEWTEDNEAFRQQEQAALAAIAQCIQMFAKVQTLVHGWAEDLKDLNVKRIFSNHSLKEWLASTEGVLKKMAYISRLYDTFASQELDDGRALVAKQEVEKYIKKGEQVCELIRKKMEEQERFLQVSDKLSEAQGQLEDLYVKEVARRQKIRLKFERMHYLQGRVRIMYRIRPKSEQQLQLQKNVQKNTPELVFPQVIVWKSPFEIHLRKQTQSLYSKGKFTFSYEPTEVDYCFEPKVEQEEVFHYLQYMVDAVFEKEDYCIFSYGQSGAGKTYSMVGPEDEVGGYKLRKTDGIVQRALYAIFQRIQQAKGKRQLILELSIKEAFATQEEETGRSVSPQPKPSKSPQPKASKNSNTSAKNSNTSAKNSNTSAKNSNASEIKGKNSFKQKSHTAKNYEDAVHIIAKAIQDRKTASTKLNDRSSRSHFLIGLTLVEGYLNRKKIGSLCLVDLAGSERQDPGKKSEQSAFINRTLSNLGRCLRQMKNYGFPAWRDCSFLEMLQPYLESSKVVAIIALSPRSTDESSNKRSVQFGRDIKE